MFHRQKLESQIKNLLKDASSIALTKDDFVLNAVFSLEKVIASITQIKDVIQERKDRININDFLIIGVEFECLSTEIEEIRREHHL